MSTPNPVGPLLALLMVIAALTPMTTTATQTGDEPGNGEYGVFIGVFLCDEPTDYQRVPADCDLEPGVTATLSTPDGEQIGSCETDGRGTCSIPAPFGVETVAAADPATVPDGYVVQDGGVSYTVPPSPDAAGGAAYSVQVALIPGTDGDAAGQPSGDDTAGDAQPVTGETDGSRAAIFAGTCDTFDPASDPLATLTNVQTPQGEQRGSSSAAPTEASATILDLPLDDILAADHVLVVFDEDDDSIPLACGSIGGTVTDDGTVAFGLPAVGASRYSGVAILVADGDQTEASVLLAENLSGTADD